VLGVDLVKDPATLVAAYDDSQGVTAAFNLNVLARANRDLGADFDLAAFEHRALWDEARRRIEMHLVSTRDQGVQVAGRTFNFLRGETIHTESSRKFTREAVERLALASSWRLTEMFESAAPSVAIAVLQA